MSRLNLARPSIHPECPILDRSVLSRMRVKTLISDASECWLWQGAGAQTGYGSVQCDGRIQLIHRVSHMLFNGPIPAGLDVDHECSTKNCWRPDHLSAVTRSENIRRAHARRPRDWTFCSRGHEMKTWGRRLNTTGRLYCRMCRRENQKRLRDRRKGMGS